MKRDLEYLSLRRMLRDTGRSITPDTYRKEMAAGYIVAFCLLTPFVVVLLMGVSK